MKPLPKKYKHAEAEPRWQREWETRGVYAWEPELPRERTYVIDTPPPTVSGVLHMGHIFSYTQADFIARYQRMRGKTVFYPMGFDDNGLPTERLVEKTIKKHAVDMSREAFITECEKVSAEARYEFRRLFESVALSVDWRQEYHTISEHSRRISQLSFLDLYAQGHVERRLEPMLWDPVDQTAIAQAEVVDKEMESAFHDIYFGVEGEEDAPIVIGTTRPELIPACVAVFFHPEDTRYNGKGKGDDARDLHGKTAITPLFGVNVPLLPDEDVQPDKGTGLVMCCTFGDEQDVVWWKRHELPLRVVLDRGGKIDFAVMNTGQAILFPVMESNLQASKSAYDGTLDTKNCLHVETAVYFLEQLKGQYVTKARTTILELLKNPTQPQDPPLTPPAGGGGVSSESDVRAYTTRHEAALRHAKALRKNATRAENKLWYECLARNLMKEHRFRRQQPIEHFIVDFACLEKRLIVELDGGQHAEEQKVYDEWRTAQLKTLGFTVLRFWNHEVLENIDGVYEVIHNTLATLPSINSSDAPPPPPAGGEGGGSAASPSYIKSSTPITHAVKCAERSGAPLEILPTHQWFVKVLDKQEALKDKGAQCAWHPEYMKVRLDQWIDGLNWDWCISRQRYFGVPFPVWYSKRAGEEGKILLPAPEQLPVNPLVDVPEGYTHEEITPESDVMDTWATSALTPQISSGRVTAHLADANQQNDGESRHAKLFPADLRPQAHEIIRTWAFYTIVKAHLHQGSIPWRNVMISGWCLAADKTKMSKSKGNVVTPVGLIEEKGADVVRYWASTSRLGADTAYSEDVLKIGKKLVTKLWNASKFAAIQLEHLKGAPTTAADDIQGGIITETLDLWILTRLRHAVDKASEEFNRYEYCAARAAIEDFFWNDLCDNYLELIKVRAYGERHGEALQQSAVYTLYHCLETVLRLFAPFVPHIAEELYSHIFEDRHAALGSIHARGSWPDVLCYPDDAAAERAGIACVSILDAVRRMKSDRSLSIKWPLTTLYIQLEKTPPVKIRDIGRDLTDATNARDLQWEHFGGEERTHTEDGAFWVGADFAEESDGG